MRAPPFVGVKMTEGMPLVAATSAALYPVGSHSRVTAAYADSSVMSTTTKKIGVIVTSAPSTTNLHKFVRRPTGQTGLDVRSVPRWRRRV